MKDRFAAVFIGFKESAFFAGIPQSFGEITSCSGRRKVNIGSDSCNQWRSLGTSKLQIKYQILISLLGVSGFWRGLLPVVPAGRVWFRKETATLRDIPKDSHHRFQHNMASFNFLIHRLLNFPLSKDRFEHEKQLIKNIAKNNGYSVHLIDKLIRKHEFKRTLYNSTTFCRDTDNSKFASLPYEPKFT
ncbi:hypothetical protein NQ318_016784, partial [Aromia moschata]